MFHNKNILIASFNMGIVGALMVIIIEVVWLHIGGLLPISAPVGFLVCFFISIWYLKFMKEKTWKNGMYWGPLFGGIAGVTAVIIILIVQIAIEIFSGSFYVSEYLPVICIVGILIGLGAGLIVGFISNLILGPSLLDWIKE